jgi:hypothetical protein
MAKTVVRLFHRPPLLKRTALGVSIVFLAVNALLAGCAAYSPPDPAFFAIDTGNLPPPDTTIQIAGLGPCTDNPDQALHLKSGQPIHVLVHGCFGSSGNFRGLAQVLAFHGQQAICFTYDDRADLTQVAGELRTALNQLEEQTHASKITLIGHSQGALIARKSLTELPLPVPQTDLSLVTISGPFSGIEAAKTCGHKWLYPLTLGFVPVSCYLFTGAKWADITYSSTFIREPGQLAPQVSHHIKIDTDESNSCRRQEKGRCLEYDDIFSLAEQQNAQVEDDPRVEHVTVQAGHVEIVGDKTVAPTKLINVLQETGVLNATALERVPDLQMLLAKLYQLDSAD